MLHGIIFLALGFLYSCSQVSVRKPLNEEVSLDAAINQARSSYLKGCVDAFHSLKVPKSFEHCLQSAKIHEQEILEIMQQSGLVPE